MRFAQVTEEKSERERVKGVFGSPFVWCRRTVFTVAGDVPALRQLQLTVCFSVKATTAAAREAGRVARGIARTSLLLTSSCRLSIPLSTPNTACASHL